MSCWLLRCGGKSMDLTSLPVPVAAPHKLKDSAWLKRSYHILNLCPHMTGVSGSVSLVSACVLQRYTTFGEETLTWTMMGASEVLRSWAGWLMVSASSTTSCRERANSKILSISLCTSADWTEHRKWSQTLAHTEANRWNDHVRFSYLSWSGCWIFRWWLSYWGCWEQTSWPAICPPWRVW